MEFSVLADQFLQIMERLPRGAHPAVISELSRGELFLLNYLFTHGGTGRPGEMSAAMRTSTARTAAALGNMEKKGWILRRPDEEDHRHTLVRLTEEGKAYIRGMRCTATDRLVRVLEELGEEDTREYLRILGRLAGIISRQQAEG